MKKQNGITLIALIITIIVMLILVGVTINVALNGGLFDTADDATTKTEKHSIYDQIVGAMKLTDNGNVNVKGTYDEVVKIFGEDKVKPTNPTTVDNIATEVTFEVTGKRGTYTYKITGTEIIIDPKKPFSWKDVNLDNANTLIEYECEDLGARLTFSEDGKMEVISTNGSKIFDLDATNIDGQIKDYSVNVGGDILHITISMNEEDKTDENIYVEMKEKGASFTFAKAEYDNLSVYSTEEVLKRLDITDYKGTYKGTWTVIGTENGKTKLVSTRNVGSYVLGNEDPRAIKVIPAVDENAPTIEEKFKRALWSYKNVETTLNEEIEKITGIIGARSIKIEDLEELGIVEVVNGGEFTFDYNNRKDDVVVDQSGNEVTIDSPDKSVTIKATSYKVVLQEDEIGALAMGGEYWLASTAHEIVPAKHCVLLMSGSNINKGVLFYSESSNMFYMSYMGEEEAGIRAIISF